MEWDLQTSGWHVRPARLDDLDGLFMLAESADEGMTNLPPNRRALGERIERSIDAFERDIAQPEDELYLLVLDDGTGSVAGTACVFSKVGQIWPFYTYRRTQIVHHSRELGQRYCENMLQLSNDFGGATEVGGLFLHPDCRASGTGRLLARSRYMLIGQSPHRFSGRIMAELRGWVAPDGSTPFWDSLGRNFFHMTLAEADRYGGIHGNQFIADLMPKYPVYVSMLPQSVRPLIGKVHESSAPALKLLMNEGFRLTEHVDIFDAGPVVECPASDLKAVSDRECGIVAVFGNRAERQPALLSKGSGRDFRCWVDHVTPDPAGLALRGKRFAEIGEVIAHVSF
jgi:arginine N-succinyltransferase